MNDIFEPVIRKLTQEIAQRLPDVPSDLKKPHVRPPKSGGAGGTAGTSSEAGLGIAAGPLGVITRKVSKAVGSFVGLFTHGSASSHGDDKEDPNAS
ncbi:MAG TPA: hypothetical protein VNW97_10270 [Candidatus Saccharimonadales bacterium]|jgi:hypothetical protein|nr:hypothetical protein [Candidatus Saccharimonadales bacterium]